jgi:type I restriction enzyme S subunit
LGYDIPESWRWQRLDELLIFGPTNGFSPKAVDYETPVRRPRQTRSSHKTGCRILERTGADRGEPNLFIYPDLMMKLRVSSAFDVGFIHLAMSHEAARDFLRTRASGTSGSMPKINQTTLKSLPLPIPPSPNKAGSWPKWIN